MCARHASELELLAFDDEFDGDVRLDEPMSRHTTYRIGGPVRAFCEVRSLAALGTVLAACEDEELAWTAIGKGSNLLVSDAGWGGVVITLAGDFRAWRFDDDRNVVTVGAGTLLPRLVQEVFHHGWSGMEFAVGTPGTVGGALSMNAGTREDWIGSRVVSVTTVKEGAGLVRRRGGDVEWSYRSTSIPADEVIVECELACTPAVSGTITDKMKRLLEARKASQPLDRPSCGSVFRNPDGLSVGALLEDAGLKGARVGGACISEKHANFIVNETGTAKAADVLALIDMAREKVKQLHGIELITEVRFLGFEE